MLRLRVLLVALAAALVSWPASIHGQRLPTRSADLHNLRSDRVRVIVQADTSGLRSVRGRLSRALRRETEGATALDLTRAELETLARDSSVVHISKDLPVVADMAVTNKVTRADSVWQGTSGLLLGLGGTPSYKGAGIGVAVLDSGIAAHSAIGSRVVARVNLVSSEPGVTGDPFGHGTHVAGMIGGAGSAASRVTSAYSGGSAPAVRFIDIRVLGAHRDGLHERRARRHRLGDRQSHEATASASSTCRSVMPSPNRPRPTRCASRSSARSRPAWWSWPRPATMV